MPDTASSPRHRRSNGAGRPRHGPALPAPTVRDPVTPRLPERGSPPATSAAIPAAWASTPPWRPDRQQRRRHRFRQAVLHAHLLHEPTAPDRLPGTQPVWPSRSASPHSGSRRHRGPATRPTLPCRPERGQHSPGPNRQLHATVSPRPRRGQLFGCALLARPADGPATSSCSYVPSTVGTGTRHLCCRVQSGPLARHLRPVPGPGTADDCALRLGQHDRSPSGTAQPEDWWLSSAGRGRARPVPATLKSVGPVTSHEPAAQT